MNAGSTPSETETRIEGSYRSASDAAKQMIHDGWGTLNWLANEQLTASQGITLGRVVIHAGQQNPRHCHPSCDEVLHLLKGKLKHSIGDTDVLLSPGDTISIPAGVFHNAVNIADEDAEMMVAYSTGRRDFQLESPK